ncbi:MAG: MerR family transcriptional regulator [Deltaproteobacteria bacterium]|nr:MAG: MerR family transcriptional regulator [Deltaproteobacteria bacterium]
MEVNISDLTWDQFIYPRAGKSDKTISAYVEALATGAQFPPIKIQRVFNYADGNETTDLPDGRHGAIIIIDGIHRWFAFKESGIKKIAAEEWKDKPLDYEKNKIALLLESAEYNISHGDRLSPSDKKRIARDIASTDQECTWTEDALAKKLGVIRQTVNTWISDIRARQKASRNTVIIRLSRLGWPQEKISETVGIKQQRISQITNNANFGNIGNLLAQGRDMEYIARHYNMDLSLVWALRLEGKTDQEKFKELGWGLRTWDQWNFNECDERFGDDWPGRIPAQLIAHTLFYFTKPGDLVLDPMAGGGVVPDVCLLFGRKCQSFDLAVRDNRPEILCHHWDPRNWNWPITKNPDLIFFDPPYYTKKQKEYSKKANENTPSISSYTKEEYEMFLEGFFLLAYQNAKETTRMAFLNADWRDFESTPALKEKPDKSITIFDYHRLLSKTGWKVTHRIECPLSSERMSGNQVQKMQDKRILGTVGRSLLIAKRS